MDALKSCVLFSQMCVFAFVAIDGAGSRLHFLHSFNSGCYRHSTMEIVAGEIVSFHITTNRFNYRQYRKLMHHFWSQVLKQRRKFNAMTMINDV